MKRTCLAIGILMLLAAWSLAAGGAGSFAVHMAAVLQATSVQAESMDANNIRSM